MKSSVALFSLWLFLTCYAAPLAAQTDVFDDDPMQERAIGQAESEYVLRAPTGLSQPDRTGVYPPNWWTGMVDPRVELMVYQKDAGRYDRATVSGNGAAVEYVKQVANPNYLFVGLRVAAGAPAQTLRLTLSGPDAADRTIDYRLLPHPRTDWADREALSSKDLIYLIMPDRFANGDPANDVVAGMNETLLNRDKFFFRHGGDLQGIIDRLDYLAELGVTALWLNPVLENDQPYASYHGYAVTDHYRIDRRFGDNETYRELVAAAHRRGIKVIMDVIFNHVGDEHHIIRDLPATDWIHQWPEYTKTTYRAPTLLDPNASEYDRKLMTDGWFDKHMPDLNQQNEQLANYLIQNSIWWTLWSGQDAYRIDTYAYADADFAAEWNRRLREEVPHIGIYGETWVHGPAVQAWFTGGRGIHADFDSHLPGVTDFQWYYAVHEALAQEPGWTSGVNRIYYTLAQDYLYEDPTKNVVFLDNHDIARLFTTVGEDMTKMKSALALLLTARGIPMLYYGTEIGLTGAGGAFGEGGRVEFPGGWPGDAVDQFTAAGRTGVARELHTYVAQLARARQQSEALTEGDFTQFVPRDGVYVYFRHTASETVMVVFNGNSKPVTVQDWTPYRELIGVRTAGVNLANGKTTELAGLTLRGKETVVLRLGK